MKKNPCCAVTLNYHKYMSRHCVVFFLSHHSYQWWLFMTTRATKRTSCPSRRGRSFTSSRRTTTAGSRAWWAAPRASSPGTTWSPSCITLTEPAGGATAPLLCPSSSSFFWVRTQTQINSATLRHAQACCRQTDLWWRNCGGDDFNSEKNCSSV